MIAGNKVSLRAILKDDVKAYTSWINDQETNHWRGVNHPTAPDQAAAWLDLEGTVANDRLTLAIDLDTHTFIGLIGLRGICSRSRRAEIWIYLGAKEYWNKGLGQDAVRTICKYAFEEMNLHRIWLECDPENVGAVKCYEKNGFKHEGTLKDGYYRHGKYRDTVMMGLIRPEWELRA